jgi:hypothetical protein
VEASVERFPSKRDGWLVAALWAGIAIAIGAPLAIWRTDPRASALALSLGALGAAFALWVLYGTRYWIEDGALRIRSGPFAWRIPLGEITGVEPSRNPLSSPACSLDRLLVRTRRGRWPAGGVLVSPDDKASFLRAMAASCPQLRLAGDRLVAEGPVVASAV